MEEKKLEGNKDSKSKTIYEYEHERCKFRVVRVEAFKYTNKKDTFHYVLEKETKDSMGQFKWDVEYKNIVENQYAQKLIDNLLLEKEDLLKQLEVKKSSKK